MYRPCRAAHGSRDPSTSHAAGAHGRPAAVFPSATLISPPAPPSALPFRHFLSTIYPTECGSARRVVGKHVNPHVLHICKTRLYGELKEQKRREGGPVQCLARFISREDVFVSMSGRVRHGARARRSGRKTARRQGRAPSRPVRRFGSRDIPVSMPFDAHALDLCIDYTICPSAGDGSGCVTRIPGGIRRHAGGKVPQRPLGAWLCLGARYRSRFRDVFFCFVRFSAWKGCASGASAAIRGKRCIPRHPHTWAVFVRLSALALGVECVGQSIPLLR